MPKEYFCTKVLPNGIMCAERDNSKFISGRYTTCKSCRLRTMSEYNKEKTIKKQDKEAEKIDPDCNIRWIVEDTIKRVPFIDKQTITERIKSSEDDITSILNLHHEYTDKNDIKIEELYKQIDLLKKEIEKLKK
jgi:transcription initiation factor IIF auxiliary subunit